LVGWPEEHVELDARAQDRGGVTAAQRGGGGSVAEQSRIEEIGTLAAGFELEAAKAQSIPRQGQVDELELIVLHATEPRRWIVARDAASGATKLGELYFDDRTG